MAFQNTHYASNFSSILPQSSNGGYRGNHYGYRYTGYGDYCCGYQQQFNAIYPQYAYQPSELSGLSHFQSCGGHTRNWRQREDIYVIVGESFLSSLMEARLGENLASRKGTILVSNLLERVKEASLPVVSGKTCLQNYVHQLFDEISVNEEEDINSSSSKENSTQIMEQVTDPKCIASIAINFSVVANIELLLDETRLRKGEQKSTIFGSSVGSLVASLKMNIFEVVKQLKERRYPTYDPQSEVIDRDFDLLIICTDSDVNKFEISYVIPNMQNSPDADLIIKFD
ncbi:hypothetical protein FXO37_05799 [Capsicum annuum]|nr:hypothetical protein FXO37_05799 [Capsicum annuum]